ncbi:hypothetical protein NIM87_13330 [Devosia sp. XJ19-1]|uniref:Type I restriction modification DNA specificity domain-containing protein n=1 Tax=Devosia ureilytica TaxID=2952754 RepID=A0A9Q4FS38_9HYPH|nr:hypothetical protein [Devosia ureilytica]MCP8884496.1 hypothetical protein [Devosia ureilytica]MCP8888126.1 hypothetical protein [Devosia ureilytica]
MTGTDLKTPISCKRTPMKDSGADWLGQVPAHWEVVPPAALFTESKERAREGDQLLSATQKYGVIPVAEFEALEQRQVTMAVVNLDMRKHVELGDFVISMRSMDGGLERARAVGSVRSSYTVLKPGPDVEGRFYGALMKSSLYIQALRLTSNFVRDGQDLNFSHVRKVKLPKPDLREQAAIADHIEVETGRIDGLIEKKTRFITLLKEKRAAVITHAVTKGIDPDAPMKDGPFKAVGMVPEIWDISPVGRALRVKKNIVGSRHGEYRLLSLTTRGVIERDISENFGKFPESFDSYQEVSPGDFVFCLFDIDETPRTVGLSDRHGMITGAYSVFDCLALIYSKYLYFLFLHLDMCKGLKPFYTGLRKTIRPPKFTSIRIPFPPENDACQIVEHIETQTAKIDSLIALTERSIDLLREKRAALITAAVTGKIDVRLAA